MAGKIWKKNARDGAWLWTGILLSILVFAINLSWARHNRFGLVLTIDETGYMSQALSYAIAMKAGGLSAWVSALFSPNIFAPLSPAISSILLSIGVGKDVAFFAPHIFCLAVIVLVVFLWLAETTSVLAAVAGACLVASMPDLILYARSYQYVTSVSLFFLLANYFYCKSDKFSSWGWSLLTGISLGLMLLSRTMSVAFLPVFGFVWVVDGNRMLMKNALKVFSAVIVFLIVAAPWYLANFRGVFGYLFSFGYGKQAAEYGDQASLFSTSFWHTKLVYLMNSFFLIHFVLVFCLFVACALWQVYFLVRYRTFPDRAVLIPTLICLLCFVLLFSSSNQGSGFAAPLFSVMAYCVVKCIYRLVGRTSIRVCLYSFIALASLFALGFQESVYACTPWAAPFVRSYANITLCDGVVDRYIREMHEKQGEHEPRWYSISRADQAGWRHVSDLLADYLNRTDAVRALVVYGTRNRLINVNTVQLALMDNYRYALPAVQIDPILLNDTYSDYGRWFDQSTHGDACAVIVMSNANGDFEPLPDLKLLKQILLDRHYKLSASFQTPEAGTSADIWSLSEKCLAGR